MKSDNGLLMIGLGVAAYFMFVKKATPSTIMATGQQPRSTSGTVQPSGTSYVKWIQAALNALMDCGLEIDGIMGAGTATCVRQFQAMRKITVDGVVGKQTDWEIHSALGEPGYIENANPY